VVSAYYFNDNEEGVARKTSHPFFVEHAAADFYYSCIDEFSPFGNDSGADTLSELQDWYNERGANDKALTFLKRQWLLQNSAVRSIGRSYGSKNASK
jgi:uncharacterized protein YfeS